MVGMSAEAVGRYMPAVITLDDLAAMIAADTHGMRYETMRRLTPAGDYEVTDQRPLAWLVQAPVAEFLPVPR